MSEGDLNSAAVAVLATADAAEKSAAARALHRNWRNGALLLNGAPTSVPDRPARPARPVLAAPSDMPKRRYSGPKGRIAALHAVAHIELNAIDLAVDMVARFSVSNVWPEMDMRAEFTTDWLQVAEDEARHFDMLSARLRELGAGYGDLPAHDGLWDAARKTAYDVSARLAIAPLVLEARGLDVTPQMIEKFERAGDNESASALRTIYHDEIKHVAAGAKWFSRYCAMKNRDPAAHFHDMVGRHFTGGLKPPFNDEARRKAGLLPVFYHPLAR